MGTHIVWITMILLGATRFVLYLVRKKEQMDYKDIDDEFVKQQNSI